MRNLDRLKHIQNMERELVMLKRKKDWQGCSIGLSSAFIGQVKATVQIRRSTDIPDFGLAVHKLPTMDIYIARSRSPLEQPCQLYFGWLNVFRN